MLSYACLGQLAAKGLPAGHDVPPFSRADFHNVLSYDHPYWIFILLILKPYYKPVKTILSSQARFEGLLCSWQDKARVTYVKKRSSKIKRGKTLSGSDISLRQHMLWEPPGQRGREWHPGSDLSISICQLCDFELPLNTYPTYSIFLQLLMLTRCILEKIWMLEKIKWECFVTLESSPTILICNQWENSLCKFSSFSSTSCPHDIFIKCINDMPSPWKSRNQFL